MRTLLLASILLVGCIAQPYQTGGISPWQPPADMELDEFISYLVAEGSAWIQSQRESLRPKAAALSANNRNQFAAYFEAETLDAIRFRVVDGIDNPGFYEELSRQGTDIPLDFSRMDGIAFIDTIAIVRRNLQEGDWARLLFHECVHVAQYRQLGVAEFVSQYVRGWADNGFDYFAIPLERQAYELDRRFSQGEVFSVEQTLAESLGRSTGSATSDD